PSRSQYPAARQHLCNQQLHGLIAIEVLANHLLHSSHSVLVKGRLYCMKPRVVTDKGDDHRVQVILFLITQPHVDVPSESKPARFDRAPAKSGGGSARLGFPARRELHSVGNKRCIPLRHQFSMYRWVDRSCWISSLRASYRKAWQLREEGQRCPSTQKSTAGNQQG